MQHTYAPIKAASHIIIFTDAKVLIGSCNQYSIYLNLLTRYDREPLR